MSKRRVITPEFIRGAILDTLPGTRMHMEKITGLAKTTIFRYTTMLHKEGAIHITSWVKRRDGDGGGKPIPIFRPGKRKDAVCFLKPDTQHVSQQRWYAKLKATGAIEERNAKQRARYFAKKAQKTPQTWLSALMVQS